MCPSWSGNRTRAGRRDPRALFAVDPMERLRAAGHRQYREYRRGSRWHGRCHRAFDWRPVALLDSGVCACLGMPVVLDQLSPHRSDLQVAHPRLVCLYRRCISVASGLGRGFVGDHDSTCAVDRRVLGDVGRYPGNNDLAISLLLAGRAGSRRGNLLGQVDCRTARRARPIGNCGAPGTMSLQACSFRTW